MEESVMFKYFLNSNFLTIDEGVIESIHSKYIKEHEEKLKSILNEKQMKEVASYQYDLVSHMFHIRDVECLKMFYLGIKLGMEVENFCNVEKQE